MKFVLAQWDPIFRFIRLIYINFVFLRHLRDM